MAFIQRNVPPPNEKETFSIDNFVGGLNNRSRQLRGNEASDILNMAFSNDTIMVKRKGLKLYDEIDLDNNVIFMDEYRTYDDGDFSVRSDGETIKFFRDDGTIYTHNGNIISGINHVGKYFFADGTDIFVFGKFPQEESTYEKITGTKINDYIVMKIVKPPDDFTPLEAPHRQGITRYNYTNKTVWYEPCKYQIEDSYLGSNVPPEHTKFLVSHQGRLFASGNKRDDDNIFITDISNPYYFAVSLPMQIPPNSDEITGMIVYDNSVVVGRREDVHILRGLTNNPNLGFDVFEMRKVNTHTGFASQHAVVHAHNYLFFVGSDGVAYALMSVNQEERVLSTTILSKQVDLEKEPINATQSDFEKATSVFIDDEWLISLGDKIMVYSYRHQAWTMYNNFDATYLYNHRGELLVGRNDGRVSHFYDGYLDLGEPYLAYWQSRNFDMEKPSTFKQFREFFMVAHAFTDYASDIRVHFEIDFESIRSDIVIRNQISRWGHSVFGDRFINRTTNISQPLMIGRRGRNFSFRFINGYEVLGSLPDVGALSMLTGVEDRDCYFIDSEQAYYVLFETEWRKMEERDLNQPMQIYQVNGEYELRGKR